MNPEIKEKWVKALRSGEYQQAKYVLKDDNKFCCLGVLCDLHAKETENKWIDGTYFTNSKTLPQKVVDWSGVNSFNPTVMYINEYNEVSYRWIGAVNDSGATFEEIADIIENQL